jgi:xanthine dehydrogenase accessory factor
MSDDVTGQIAREVLAAAGGGQPVAVATVVRAPEGATPAAGAKLLVRLDGSRLGSLGGGALEEAVVDDAHSALTTRPRAQVETLHYTRDGARGGRHEAAQDALAVMIEVTEQPATLVIVGAGHVGLSIATIAAHVGFSVMVLDDRASFANDERFPMADRVICGDMVEALRGLAIDSATYIVLVSRGHKQDELALREVVSSGAAYVGMIGSQRRVSTVLSHLAREGYPREGLERVHTPIGLDIGAETPEEIAVSVLAEIIAVRRGGSGGKLSELRRVRIRE